MAFLVIGEGGEEVEAGETFDVVHGDGEVGQRLAKVGGVGEDDGKRRFAAALDGEDGLEEMRGDGDVVGANGFGVRSVEECAGDDVGGIG